MSRIELTIPTPDGQCPASLHVPAGDVPRPAVIIYPDAIGVRETFQDLAAWLAGLGYVALLPKIYYRHGDYPPLDARTAFSDPSERARLMTMARGITPSMTISDTGAFLDVLAARPEVSGAGVGTTGYCMGGRAALLAAAYHPARITAAASFHGSRLAPADDPDGLQHSAGRVRATVYVAAAENDASCPADQLDRLEQAYTAGGVRHTIETYPARHGFAVPDTPSFDPAAADRHRRALERLFADALAP